MRAVCLPPRSSEPALGVHSWQGGSGMTCLNTAALSKVHVDKMHSSPVGSSLLVLWLELGTNEPGRPFSEPGQTGPVGLAVGTQQAESRPSSSLSSPPVNMCLFQSLGTFIQMAKQVSSHLLCDNPCALERLRTGGGGSSHDFLPGSRRTKTSSTLLVSRHLPQGSPEGRNKLPLESITFS